MIHFTYLNHNLVSRKKEFNFELKIIYFKELGICLKDKLNVAKSLAVQNKKHAKNCAFHIS